MSSGGTPYIGSKISLISKAEIRYEGILYDVNTKDSTVTLSKVRSHGTEGRPAAKPIQPRSEVYEYIIFRGSDIKDLSVNEVAKPSVEEQQDPAILSTHSTPPVSQAPPPPSSQAPPPAPLTSQPLLPPPTTQAPPTNAPTTQPPTSSVLQNPPGLPLQAPPPHSIPPIFNTPYSLGGLGSGSSYNPFGLPYFGRPPLLLSQQTGAGILGGPVTSKGVAIPQRISSSVSSSQTTPPQSEGVSSIIASSSSPMGGKAGTSLEATPPTIPSVSSIDTSTPSSTVSPLQYSVSAVDSSSSRPSANDSVVQPHEVTSSTNDSSRDNEDTEEPSAGTRNPPNQQGGGGGGGGGQRRRPPVNRERGTGPPRGGFNRQPRPYSGGQRPPSDSAPPNGVVAKQPLRYDSDFDFDIANALFSKDSLEKEIKEKLKINTDKSPTGEETVDQVLRGVGSGEEVGVVSDRVEEEEESVGSYNKEVSFFDNISCEANSSSKRYDRNVERALNTETFGITSRGPPRGRWRGGRGQRGRGYSRGGRGGYDRSYRFDDNYSYNGRQRDSGYRGDRQGDGGYRGDHSRGYDSGSQRGRGRSDYHGDNYRSRNNYYDNYHGQNSYHGDGYRGRNDRRGNSYRRSEFSRNMDN